MMHLSKRYILCLIFSFLLFPLFPSLISQSPLSIPYQAVVRNTDGSTMASAAVTITFKIHDNSTTGTVVYEETHATTTNAQGLVSLNVGGGTAMTGTFSGIQWGTGSKFLHVLMNVGNGVVDLGTQQMMSVPYALYAANSQPGPQGETGAAGLGITSIEAQGTTLIITLSNGTVQTIPFPVSQKANDHSNTLIYSSKGF